MKQARLTLLRHAKSDWNTDAARDFDRPLAGRGRKDAPTMGKWLKKNDFIPDIILCSPALRTRQTLEIVNGKLGVKDKNIFFEDSIYEASLADLLAVIEKYSHSNSNILLIGHNPGLDELLCFLCRTQPAVSETGKLMTTAAVATLEFADNKISTAEGRGELLHLLRPKELRAATG